MFIREGDRSPVIDVARGIGVLFVVAGHIFSDGLQSAIYAFHMPLFFIIAGMVYRQKSLRHWLMSRLLNVVVPTVAFGLAICLSVVGISIFVGGPRGAVDTLQDAHGSGYFVVFWFPVVLLASELVLNMLDRLGSAGLVAIAICLVLSYVLAAVGTNSPLSVLATLHAVPLIHLGRMVKRCDDSPTTLPLALTVAWVGIGTAYFWRAASYNFKEEYYGLPVFTLMVALASTLSILFASQSLSRMRATSAVLTTFGRLSLAVMFIHQPVQIALKNSGMKNDLLRFGLTVAISISICMALASAQPTRWIFLGRRTAYT